ncbi:MAG: DUF6485 family protein [bacterium]|jgi:hypothetical protein|nr:DUF6485 family protein [bacterium]
MSHCSNPVHCTCTYPGCPHHGKCCDCLAYHLQMDQLPACCFSAQDEKTYDRSFRKFVQAHKDLLS